MYTLQYKAVDQQAKRTVRVLGLHILYMSMEIVDHDEMVKIAEWGDDEFDRIESKAQNFRDKLLQGLSEEASEAEAGELAGFEPTTDVMDWSIASFYFTETGKDYIINWDIVFYDESGKLSFEVWDQDQGTVFETDSVEDIAEWMNEAAEE